jgi:hypothetical protein
MFCFACGEPINDPKTPESKTASNDRDLFHCSNLQGIILGVGLAMLEQLYHDQLQNPPGSENKVRTSKRRKTDPVINTPMILDPDDDDDNYLSPPPQGKKSRLGVGYAGDQKEDVSSHPRAFEAKLILAPIRPLDKQKPRRIRSPRMKNWAK